MRAWWLAILLLLAIGLASKRRPAEPLEIVAAIDLIQGNIPAEAKLSEAIARLAVHGLIGEVDGRCQSSLVFSGYCQKAL